ncbi:hypothetical protein KOW79_017431 [Hemibagrus wyckioides]|uniref:Uncharacterized protein n=1 Tax=Hemibagrus wyckioides TaxID=337641 RepID=A0A9D3NB46_9TELE|nr:hypothetical protein KOW79_017431 [Hemibagrus wyckioides]
MKKTSQFIVMNETCSLSHNGTFRRPTTCYERLDATRPRPRAWILELTQLLSIELKNLFKAGGTFVGYPVLTFQSVRLYLLYLMLLCISAHSHCS